MLTGPALRLLARAAQRRSRPAARARLRPKQVRRLFLAEGAVLALVGQRARRARRRRFTRGSCCARWPRSGAARSARSSSSSARARDAGRSASSPACVVALLAMWLASRRQLRHSARELLARRDHANRLAAADASDTRSCARCCRGGCVCCSRAAHAPSSSKGRARFFGAGALLLIAGLSLGARLAARASRGARRAGSRASRNSACATPPAAADAASRPSRVLASGVFMVVAVDSFRQAPPSEATPAIRAPAASRWSANPRCRSTKTSTPPKGREAYGLSDETMRDVHVVPMRVRDGDDASCLNLNRALQPRLLGVKPAGLRRARRVPFLDAKTVRLDALARECASADGAIPGIVDANTLQWALQKKLGDALEYRTSAGSRSASRSSRTVAGSILQGNVLIAERRVRASNFPNSRRLPLLPHRLPAGEDRARSRGAFTARSPIAASNSSPRPSASAEFQAVENTYLSIFQALGGLGLLLGSRRAGDRRRAQCPRAPARVRPAGGGRLPRRGNCASSSSPSIAG